MVEEVTERGAGVAAEITRRIDACRAGADQRGTQLVAARLVEVGGGTHARDTRSALTERCGDRVDVVGDRSMRGVEAGDAEEVAGCGDRRGGRCRGTQPGEEHSRPRAGGRRRIDSHAERLEAGRPAVCRAWLGAVGGRHVVVGTRELADADDRRPQVVDVGGASSPCGGDAIVDEAGFDCGAVAAGRLDLLEDVPRPLGELVGEPLDVPRPAGRVDHPGHVRLQFEDRLGVAGQPRRQVARRSSNGSVVRQHGDRIGAADGGREAGDRGAHDVDGTVVAGRHRP